MDIPSVKTGQQNYIASCLLLGAWVLSFSCLSLVGGMLFGVLAYGLLPVLLLHMIVIVIVIIIIIITGSYSE